MAAKNKKSDFISTGPVAQNRRAGFDYFINEKFVAGLELTGTEVKSLRLGHANMFIAEYANKGYESHAEKRDRKLLLKKKEINDIVSALAKKGATLVAIRLFFNEKGRAKLEVGLGTGKKNFDKRETIKNRDWNREKARVMAKFS